MSILKCKMCGGNIEIVNGSTVGICNCCGSTTTLPKIDDDRLANLFNRANHFRMSGDFDKAANAYEHILDEDDSIAEAHWGAVLSKFGIEYVEDPDSHKRIPTCHRTSWDSILRDVDYLDALKYAEPTAKAVYEEEAKTIDNIQKGILSISKSEEPYDIFICYKETTDGGSRTKDSVLAQDLYDRLVKAGYRVFFSRITLEDKLGTQYEPYIFSALNSAKVMLVIGTSADNFNAVWVKNEWSRFLQLCKKDTSKHLIPCYRDMDAYDMPEELLVLQSQDMSKIGFEQDLLRGIEKIIDKNKNATAKQQNINNGSNSTIVPLLERAYMFLDDGNWPEANKYCERVLDQEPKNAQAYLGKLMADCRVHKQEELKDCSEPFDRNTNYQKVIRFGTPTLIESLKGDIAFIRDRNETARKTAIYNQALEAMKAANSEEDYKAIAAQLESISGFNDADSFAKESAVKAEELRKVATYSMAKAAMGRNTLGSYMKAINAFRTIPGWKDADELIFACQHNIEKIRAKEEEERIEAERQAEQQTKEARLSRERASEEKRIAEARAAAKKKKQNYIVVLITVICVAIILIILNIENHKCGDHLKWDYDKSSTTLTISGTGEMRNYIKHDDVPWAKDRERIQTVILENGVTSIGDSAFYCCNNLTSVMIPDSVIRVEDSAFSNCNSLTDIMIPSNVTYIGAKAFFGCNNLTSVVIPNNVTVIGSGAFYDCDSLTTITIPYSVAKIETSAFYGCDSLTSVTVPVSITSIESSAFCGCDSLTSITYAGTVAEWKVFADCFDGSVECIDGIYQ